MAKSLPDIKFLNNKLLWYVSNKYKILLHTMYEKQNNWDTPTVTKKIIISK